MRNLTDAELLAVWEQGYGQNTTFKAQLLLGAVFTDREPEALSRLTLGQRNSLLLRFREHWFGTYFSALSNCQSCNDTVEVNFNGSALLSGAVGAPDENLYLVREAYNVRFRLPTTGDMLFISTLGDPARCREALLCRCVLSAKQKGDDISPTALPNEVMEGISKQMEKNDPLAAVELTMACPHCRHQFEVAFDIADYLCGEIDTWAKRLLLDVHVLASVYHWSETDILAMGNWRRQVYLAMVGV